MRVGGNVRHGRLVSFVLFCFVLFCSCLCVVAHSRCFSMSVAAALFVQSLVHSV